MVEINELLTDTRFPPGVKFALMIAYFPIGVFLIVCRVLIALHTYMIVCLLPRASARRQLVRAMLGVLGVHIWVDEDVDTANDRPRVLVSNYTSVLDHIVLDVVISHIVPYHANVPMFFRWVLGYKDLGSSKGKEQFIENIKTFIQDTGLPIYLQPEGAPTNNNVGLLKFDSLAYQLELPVQPISITMSRLSFPCALTTIESPKWTDVLWCFFTPVTVFKVKTHPITERGEEESQEEYIERTRGIIGDFLNLEKTDYTAEHVAQYTKKMNTPPPPVVKAKTVNTHNASSSHTGTGSCMDSVDIEVRRMIQQVKDVLPQVPITAVKQDLELTKDVDVTISNILEGRVVYSTTDEDSKETSSTSQPSSQINKDTVMFKASSFPKNPTNRHLSLEDRKKQMLETARLRYKHKHGLL